MTQKESEVTAKRILFVDDDPKVLNHLEVELRGSNSSWEVDFVGGGEQALEAMEKAPYDVVVTDAEMPGLDGVQLLNLVMLRYPETLRVISSLPQDLELVMKGVGPSQQFLTKPADCDDLVETITRTLELRDLLNSDSLARLVARLDSVPTLPGLYFEIKRALRSESTSLKAVGGLISRDPGMTAKLLALVNSGLFGVRVRVTSPDHAVSLIGMNMVQALVCACQVFSRFSMDKIRAFSTLAFENHASHVGAFARAICLEEGLSVAEAEDALLAGCLHSLGQLVLADNIPGRYASILKYAEREGIPHWLVEEKVFDTHYAKVGAFLMGIWGFSREVVEAIAFHLAPAEAKKGSFGIIHAVHAAHVLDQCINPSHCIGKETRLQKKTLEELGKGDVQWKRWKEICKEVLA